MSGKKLAIVLAAIGAMMMLSSWGSVSEWVEATLRQDTTRGKEVVYWTSSGSPEVDLKRAREFEKLHPSVNVQPNFRESGGLQDILFVSFLSGNPPDYMSTKANEMRKYVLMGGIYPLDSLLQAEQKELARQGKDYYDQFLIGKARIHRFQVNPNDRLLREYKKNPLAAARLLHMNGKAIGIRGVSTPRTITYNKRIFREADKMFPDEGLVKDGEPVPPESWLEFYRVAEVLTRYGKAVAKERGLKEPYCYGVVLQGQKQRDIVRGIKGLAAVAGSTGFAFKGDTSTVHQHLPQDYRKEYQGKPIGHFEYDSPAHMAAFALIVKLKQEGLILPGTEARHYEDVRTQLALGKAGMVIDAAHAAIIGAERVPWAAQDLGSAPIPTPYHEEDPNHGWTAEKVEDEKRQLHRLLELDELGIELAPGNKHPRTAEEGIEFFTSLCRNPQATWDWLHYTTTDVNVMKAEARRGTYPQMREALKHLDDPEWFPYPYQMQIYDILQNHSAMWPEQPLHGPVQPAHQQNVLYKYFYQNEITDLSEIVAKARAEVAEFNDAANKDLARKIVDGQVRPEDWTFPQWDTTDAERFFEIQQKSGQSEEVRKELTRIRAELIEYMQGNPGPDVVADGKLAEDVWKWRKPSTALQLVWVPLLMLGVVGCWFVVMAVRNLRSPEPLLARAGLQARRNWHGYAFVLPGMLAIFAFAIYPSLYQFGLAAHSGDGLGAMKYVGMDNFRRILDFTSDNWDSVFWYKVVPNTLLYMIVVMIGQICLGLFVASLLNLPLRANKVYRVFFFVPLVTSLAIVSVVLIGLLRGEDSGVNQFLRNVGLENLPYWLGLAKEPGQMIDWLGSDTGLATVMAVGIWHGLPYNVILLLAGLQSISPSLYEAAKVDGAGAWKRFIHVTIPEMLPILIIIAFNAFIGAARAFSSVFVLTEGGADHSSELVATYVFKKGFMKPEGQEPDLGYASALGIVYSVMLATLTAANVIIIARRWMRRLKIERRGAQVKEGVQDNG